MTRAVAAIFALLILAIGGVYGLDAALANAGADNIIRGEALDTTADTVITLDHSNIEHAYYDNQVEVYNNSDVLMVEGEDYEWFEDNGTVKPLSGGDLAGEPSATITYGYQVTTSEQRDLTALLSNIPASLGWLFPMFIVVLALLFLRGA